MSRPVALDGAARISDRPEMEWPFGKIARAKESAAKGIDLDALILIQAAPHRVKPQMNR
jgi:hypothetical protein